MATKVYGRAAASGGPEVTSALASVSPRSRYRGRVQAALWTIAFVLAASSMLASDAGGQQVDRIVPQSGPTISGEITATSKDEIVITVGGQSQKVPANQVRYVVFADEPSTLRQIRDAVNKGNIERAERYLQNLSRDKVDQEFGVADLQFYEALLGIRKAIISGAGLADSARAMVTFVTQHRDTFHFYPAAEALGDIAVAMQRPEDAAKYYGALEKSPWKDVQLRGTVRMADALRAAGGEHIADALKRYEALLALEVEGDDAKRQKERAQIGKAVCQAELGQAESAIQVLIGLIAKTPNNDSEMLASAYNALGLCYQSTDRPKDALLAFLRVELLFPDQAAARAEALYHIQALWGKLEQPNRSIEARQTLQTEFPNSTWAKKLNDAL